MDHPDILASVKRAKTTMTAISLQAGLCGSAVGVALKRPFRRAEEALIRFLDVPAHEVFPGRYDADGRRLIQQGGRAHRGRILNTSRPRRAKGQ